MWILRIVYRSLLRLFSALDNLQNNFDSYTWELRIRRKFQNHGITIGGNEPWDIQVHDPKFFSKIAFHPAIGIVESYTDGLWTPNNFSAFSEKLIIKWSKLTKLESISGWKIIWIYFYEKYFNSVSSMRNPPCLCGIKLCVDFMDWVSKRNSVPEGDSEIQENITEDDATSELDSTGSFGGILNFSNLSNFQNTVVSRRSVSIREDLIMMGLDSCDTLEAWIKNFESKKLTKQYGDNFYRMWQFYLHAVAASFRFNKC